MVTRSRPLHVGYDIHMCSGLCSLTGGAATHMRPYTIPNIRSYPEYRIEYRIEYRSYAIQRKVWTYCATELLRATLPPREAELIDADIGARSCTQ